MKRKLDNCNHNKETNLFYNFIFNYNDIFSLILIYFNISELVPLCRLLYKDLNNKIINDLLENHLLKNYENIFVNFNNVIYRDTVSMYLEEINLNQKDMIELLHIKINHHFKNNILLSNLCEFGVCDYCKTIPLDFEKAFIYPIKNFKFDYEYNTFYVCNNCKIKNEPLWLDFNQIKVDYGKTLELITNLIIFVNKDIRKIKMNEKIHYYKKDINDNLLSYLLNIYK